MISIFRSGSTETMVSENGECAFLIGTCKAMTEKSRHRCVQRVAENSLEEGQVDTIKQKMAGEHPKPPESRSNGV